MKPTILIGAGLLACGLFNASDAAAQGQPMPAPPPAAMPHPPAAAIGLASHEIVALVRATGLEPLSRPTRLGSNYSLHAVDPTGQPVRVTVDGRAGRILAVAPVAHTRSAAPGLRPSSARTAGGTAVPDGYGPPSRTTALPPGFESTNTPSRLMRGPGRIATATPGGLNGATPLPRPRPKVAASDPMPTATVPPQAVPQAAAPTPESAAPSPSRNVAPQDSPTAAPAAVIEQHE